MDKLDHMEPAPTRRAIVLAGLSAPLLLERALARKGGGYASAGLAAGLGYLLPVMVYQLHYELEFPFDGSSRSWPGQPYY